MTERTMTERTTDVFAAVDSRISCRWFLDTPVDAELVRDLIARAARAASGGNLQPWQVYALTGAALADLKRQVATSIAGRDPRQEAAEYPIYPETMWEPYKSRHEHHGVQLYGALEIDRTDAAARLTQYKRNYEFFNAPVAVFIAIDRRLGPGQWARMHRIVGAFVKMPPEQMLFCAVSIGYGDRSHPANSFRSPRAAPEEFCKFFGFE